MLSIKQLCNSEAWDSMAHQRTSMSIATEKMLRLGHNPRSIRPLHQELLFHRPRNSNKGFPKPQLLNHIQLLGQHLASHQSPKHLPHNNHRNSLLQKLTNPPKQGIIIINSETAMLSRRANLRPLRRHRRCTNLSVSNCNNLSTTTLSAMLQMQA